jgi:Flp pilus assembly protein TadB
VHVITTAPRVSGYVVGALPVILAAAMFFIQRRDFDLLISDPLGHTVLMVCGTLSVIGFFLNRRIASVEM